MKSLKILGLTRGTRLARAFAALFMTVLAFGLAAAAAVAQSSVRPPGAPLVTPEQSGAASRLQAGGDQLSTDMWRGVRHGTDGVTNMSSPDAGVLIQSQGMTWLNWRGGYVAHYGGWMLIAVLLVIALYFLIRGRIRIHAGRSGRHIPRFSLVERVVHWFTASLFLLLAITGLLILFGRPVLQPLIGKEAFSIIASASMQGHNLFGPLFVLSILAMLVTFIRGNGYKVVDIVWLFKGGGFFGGHASSYKYNFGEKTWFWWSVIMGLALSASGFALLFPDALPEREAAQIANLVHAGAALLFIAFAIGHIYIGTLGMEGALEGMTRGSVDENWAKEHHDLWWAEHKDQAIPDEGRAQVIATEAGDGTPAGIRP